jgi:type I restriction enzyme M protein
MTKTKSTLAPTITLADILKDSAYKLTQFSPSTIATLEACITVREGGKKAEPYVHCLGVWAAEGKPPMLNC